MSTARDTGRAALMDLAPELSLLASIVMQALHDARSRRAAIREEARQFLEDEAALTWWGEVLGLDGALARYVEAVLRDGP